VVTAAEEEEQSNTTATEASAASVPQDLPAAHVDTDIPPSTLQAAEPVSVLRSVVSPPKTFVNVRVSVGPSPALSIPAISDRGGNGVESFTDPPRESSASRIDQRGSRAEAKSRRERPYASSRINRTARSHRGSTSHQFPHSTAWDPLPRPRETQQPQTANTPLSRDSINRYMNEIRLGRQEGQQESLPQVSPHRLSQRSQRSFGGEYGNSSGMSRGSQIRLRALGLIHPQELLVFPTTPLLVKSPGLRKPNNMQKPNEVRSLRFLIFRTSHRPSACDDRR
jgi:hypothetical protein